MSFFPLLLILLLLSVLFCLQKYLNFDDKEHFQQYSLESLCWLKNRIIYPCFEGEIDSVHLNSSDDKSLCYQNGNKIYCEENIRTSDIKDLHKELIVNEVYLKRKLQETFHQQHLFGQIPKLKVLGIAVHHGKFIIAMELVI